MNILTVKKDTLFDALSGAILCLDLAIALMRKSKLIQADMIERKIKNFQDIQKQIKEHLIIKIDG